MTRKDVRDRSKEVMRGNWLIIIVMIILINLTESAYSGVPTGTVDIFKGGNADFSDAMVSVMASGRRLNLLGLITTFISYVLMGGLHLGILKIIQKGVLTFGDIIDIISENLKPIGIIAAIVTLLNVIFTGIPILNFLFNLGFIVLYPFFFMEIKHFESDNFGDYINRVLKIPGRIRADMLIHFLYYIILPMIVTAVLGFVFTVGIFASESGAGTTISVLLLSLLSIGFLIIYMRNSAIMEVVRGVEYEYKDRDILDPIYHDDFDRRENTDFKSPDDNIYSGPFVTGDLDDTESFQGDIKDDEII